MALSRISYREHLPSQALRPHVRVIWEMSGPCDDPAPQRIIPDGAMSLWFNFGAPFTCEPGPGHDTPAGGTLLLGELRRPFEVASNGALDLIGVNFWPGYARTFIDAPLRELVDRVVETPPLADTLARSVYSAEARDRIGLIELALIDALQRARVPSSPIRRALELLERDVTAPRVASLAKTLGLSTRQLERRFADEVGIAPKAFASVLRFRRALDALVFADQSPSEVALSCGYVDQSHLIRDFTRFAGAPPARFVAVDAPRNRAEWLARAQRPAR